MHKKIEDLKKKIPPVLYDAIKDRGIKELRSFQIEAINKGILDGKNFVISAPTASGKTLLAEMASLKSILLGKGKALHLVPLKALAQEFYENFKNWYNRTGVKIAISTGDLDSPDHYLSGYDWIIATTEKVDSLLRHGANWTRFLSTIVIDELHLLGEEGRGATLEVLMTKFSLILPKAQLIGLSATISNAKELASWMKSVLVESDFRPVPLYEGIYENSKIHLYEKGIEKNIEKSIGDNLRPDLEIIEDTLLRKKQILVFLSTRRIAESMALRAGRLVSGFLNEEESHLLQKLAKEVTGVLEKPTSQCERLGQCIEKGVAFHHAGVTRPQLTMIENAFRQGLIKMIACTPTLAFGVNLPSNTCLVRDLKRFNENEGYTWISVLEFKQYGGRAGRPDYDEEGRVLTISTKKGEYEEILNRFIKGSIENIYSQLFDEASLRVHLLSLIANLFIKNFTSAIDFFSKTLFFFQFGKVEALEEKIKELLKLLEKWEFIEEKNRTYTATPLGRRINELYLDPLDGWQLITFLRGSSQVLTKNEFTYLQVISDTRELSPPFRVSNKEMDEIERKISLFEDNFWKKEPPYWSSSYERFIRVFKTALVFHQWINEKTERIIEQEFKVPPGELYTKVQSGEWVLYATEEIGKLLKLKDDIENLRSLRIRMHYGIKEELLDLVRLKEIGRVRARFLYNVGYKRTRDLRKASLEDITKILGPKIAKKIKEQL